MTLTKTYAITDSTSGVISEIKVGDDEVTEAAKIKRHERVNPATGEMEVRGGTRRVSFRSAGELKARMNPER